MASIRVKRGQGLLPSVIDALAEAVSPRVFASIPCDDYDLSQDFRDINYRQFANAINHAAYWLDEKLGQVGKGSGFPTFSYEDSKDLRFPILTVAATKTHRTVSLMQTLIVDKSFDTEQRCLFYRLWCRSKAALIFLT